MTRLFIACLVMSGCGAPGGGGGGGGGNFDAQQQHTLTVLNGHRAQNGVAPLALDAQLSTFAIAASQALANGGAPHGYFQSQGSQLFKVGFCGLASENQAPGWPAGADVNATITAALKAMMDEGPGGGHHDNIVDPRATRVGVGIVVQSNRLYFTNDFSGNCK